jgi:ubiquinone/menaquinone biosynthesis C-methylase UbiE
MNRILDVGCGTQKARGAIGIDKDKDSNADVTCDLNHIPYPFKDNEFDQVICKQALEHLDSPLETLRELHRIAKPQALIIIEVPHFSCFYAFCSLHHKRFFSYFSLDSFIKKHNLFQLHERHITFHRAHRRWGLNLLFNRYPLSYERFWAFICPAEHIHFELKVIK